MPRLTRRARGAKCCRGFLGHSILIIDGRHATFKDSDLLVVSCLAVEAMWERERLGHVAAAWQAAIEGRAPGAVCLPLEPYVHDTATRQELLCVLADVEVDLRSMGASVPMTRLNAMCSIPGMWFDAPYPTSLLLAAVGRLRELIAS